MTEQEFDGMKQELAMFQLNALKRFAEIEKAIGEFQSSHTGLERLGGLEDRISVLESARSRQIQVNADLLATMKAALNQEKESWLKKLIK